MSEAGAETPLPPRAAPLVTALRAAGCVFAEDEARILLSTARDDAELSAMVERRAAGLPLEHVVGWAEFCGLRVAVDPGVFVPRRRTEFLARQAAARTPEGAVVVELCCGTGAVAAYLAGLRPAELHAADLDPAAAACARRNLTPLGGTVHEGDLYAPLPAHLAGRVDVLVANGPYVPTGDLPLLPAEARDHERRLALDGGADGLDILRRVAADAAAWLAPGGHAFMETSDRQAATALAAVRAAGLHPVAAEDEDLGATVIIARRP
jgi:release factor glutamine methyltransferase